MKSIIRGKLAAALLAAPLLVFGMQMASCGGATTTANPVAPSKNAASPSTMMFSIVCTDPNCGLTFALHDSSPNQPVPKIWAYVTATQDIKANTTFQVELAFNLDSLNAHYKTAYGMAK